MTTLTPLEPLKRHQDVRLHRTENTGTWLLNLESFCEWQECNENNNRVFCCYGIPGAGKTVIWYGFKSPIDLILKAQRTNVYYYLPYSSVVIDDLYSQFYQRTNIGIACLYADYKDQNTQTVVHILGSFLHQLLATATEPIPDEVIQKLQEIKRLRGKLSTEDSLALLKIRIHQLKQAFICIDAVDELEPSVCRQLLRILEQLSTKNIRIFLTGRHYIQSEVQKCFQIAQKYTVTISASSPDIEAFTRQQILDDPYAEGAMDEVLETEIIDAIIEKSQGM